MGERRFYTANDAVRVQSLQVAVDDVEDFSMPPPRVNGAVLRIGTAVLAIAAALKHD